MRIQRNRGNGTVSDRHLPRAYHLIPGHHPGNAAVANGDEKAFGGDSGEGQDAFERLRHRHRAGIKIVGDRGMTTHAAMHFRGLAEQDGHRQIDGGITKIPITHQKMLRIGRLANHGIRAALALADGFKARQ